MQPRYEINPEYMSEESNIVLGQLLQSTEKNYLAANELHTVTLKYRDGQTHHSNVILPFSIVIDQQSDLKNRHYYVISDVKIGEGAQGDVFDVLGTLRHDDSGRLIFKRHKSRVVKEELIEGQEILRRIAVKKEAAITPRINEIHAKPAIRAKINSHEHQLIIQKKIPGKSFEQLINNDRAIPGRKSLSVEQRFRITINLLGAIQSLHLRHKIIHGDIRPGNVMVDLKNCQVKLIDFGFSHDIGDTEYCVPSSHLYQAPSTFVDGITNVMTDAYAAFMLVALLWGAGERPDVKTLGELESIIKELNNNKKEVMNFNTLLLDISQLLPDNLAAELVDVIRNKMLDIEKEPALIEGVIDDFELMYARYLAGRNSQFDVDEITSIIAKANQDKLSFSGRCIATDHINEVIESLKSRYESQEDAWRIYFGILNTNGAFDFAKGHSESAELFLQTAQSLEKKMLYLESVEKEINLILSALRDPMVSGNVGELNSELMEVARRINKFKNKFINGHFSVLQIKECGDYIDKISHAYGRISSQQKLFYKTMADIISIENNPSGSKQKKDLSQALKLYLVKYKEAADLVSKIADVKKVMEVMSNAADGDLRSRIESHFSGFCLRLFNWGNAELRDTVFAVLNNDLRPAVVMH